MVALPTSIVAFLKLRKADLRAILEGGPAGVNARMKLTRKQRRFFTQKPAYPRSVKGIIKPWKILLLLILFVLSLSLLAAFGWILL